MKKERESEVSFDVSPEEAEIIQKIAKRATSRNDGYSQMDALMDVTACHANGCPLRLPELLAAKEFSFVHDVYGIRRHLNRTSGQLENGFLPRYHRAPSARERAAKQRIRS